MAATRFKDLGFFIGTGYLLRDGKALSQVKYQVQLLQEMKSTEKGEIPGLYNSYCKFYTIDEIPEISPEDNAVLKMQDGREADIRIINYDWGYSEFELSKKIERLTGKENFKELNLNRKHFLFRAILTILGSM